MVSDDEEDGVAVVAVVAGVAVLVVVAVVASFKFKLLLLPLQLL